MSPHLALALAACCGSSIASMAPPPSDEVVRTPDGVLLTATNTTVDFGDVDLAILVPGAGMSEDALYFWWEVAEGERTGEGDVSRLGGPFPWGVADGAVYAVNHRRDHGYTEGVPVRYRTLRSTRVVAYPNPIRDVIRQVQNNRHTRDRETGRRLSERISTFTIAHLVQRNPLQGYIIEHAAALNREWDLFFDVVYTSLDDVTTVAVRDGMMHLWEVDETGNLEAAWTTIEPFSTTIDGPFRVVRAGEGLEAMYFVDETGGIHTGRGGEHRRIGTAKGFTHGGAHDRTLVFEDQQEEQIAILRAAPDGTITPLAIEWAEQGHERNFRTTLDDPNLERRLQKMAEILRGEEE